MTADSPAIDPTRVAAILYRPQDDVDTLLADFAEALVRKGERIGGIVQRNIKGVDGCHVGMQAIELLTGREISICQPLGSGSSSCKLDPRGLAEAAVAITNAIHEHVALVVINKFAKQEASGHGLRDEFAEAITAGIPVLTAIPESYFQEWTVFTGGIGTTLPCDRQAIERWWLDLSSRMARMREDPTGATVPAISRSSHRMT